MEWYHVIFELIDLRSFSNLWYWIALAVLWSSASHWVMGVPFDMITRARKDGGDIEQDVQTMVRINTNRMLYIARTSGLWLIGFASFMVTTLLVLAVFYSLEFAQAVLFLLVPMMILGAMSLYTAQRIAAGEGLGEALYRRLSLHRRATQGLGMISIFVTSLFGMWQNMHIGVLG